MSVATVNYKELSISERIQLVEDIWDSVAQETPGTLNLSPEQTAELHRRYAAHQADPTSSISWSEVRASLFKRQA